MTEQERLEIKAFLRAKGLSDDIIRWALNAAENEERVEEFRDSTDARRYQELRNFEPNPGKATLTQVGETQTYLGGDDRGLPIYQEDVDMIKKALPLAKRLIELQKTRPQEPAEEKPLSEMTAQERIDRWFATGEKEEQTLRTLRDTIDEVYEIDPEDLNMGPDTTENINEVRADDIPEKAKQSLLRSQGIKKNENMTHDDFPGAGDWKEWRKEHEDVLGQMKEEDIRDSGDVMFGIDLETQGLQGNFEPREQWEENLSNVAPEMLKPGFWEEYYRKKKTPEIIIDDLTYPSKEEVEKRIEECNKNVSQPMNKDLPFPGDVTKYSYGNILSNMEDTHNRKNSDYGDAAYQGYKKFGDYYFLVQLHNKLSRLESLTINNKTQQVKDESIDDTLLDMANYAVMYLESRHRND